MNGCEIMAADGSIVVEATVDASQAQAEINRLEKKIESLKARVRDAEASKLPWLEQSRELAARLDEAKARLFEMENAGQGIYSTEQIDAQRETVRSLQLQWENVDRTVAGYNRTIDRSNVEIAGAESRVGGLQKQLVGVGTAGAVAGKTAASGMTSASAAVQKLERRIVGLIRRVFVFSLITKALRSVRTWLSNAIKANDEAAAAFAELKQAAIDLVSPLVERLIPALTLIANVLTVVVRSVTAFLDRIFSWKASDTVKGLQGEQKAISGVGKAAKKASGQLANFDEVNKLAGDTSAGGGGAGTKKSGGDNLLDGLEKKVTAALLIGGVALIVIGAALFNLGLVLAGLTLLGAGIKYGSEKGVFDDWAKALGLDRAEEFVTAALLIAGMASLVIGIVLKNYMLVFAGAAMLGAGIAYGASTGTFSGWAEKLGLNTVFDYIVAAIQLVGIALVAIGASMGNIAMIIAGAGILAVGIIAEAIGEKTLKSWWETLKLTTVQQWIAVVMLLSGIALVAIGAALKNIAMVIWGLGLISAGAFAGNTEEGSLADWAKALGLEKVMGWVTAALLLGGIALLILAIIHPTPALILAALGMLGAGVTVGLSSGTFAAWLDVIIKGLKNLVQSIKTKVLDPIVTAFQKFYNGVMSIIEGIINGFVGFINGFIRGINRAIETINKIPGVNLGTIRELAPVTVKRIPALAQGAVIPPNREFLAVLGDQKRGTNVEAPLDTIVAAFRQAMREGAGSRTVVLQLDDREFGRVVFDAYNTEDRRVGVRLGGVL